MSRIRNPNISLEIIINMDFEAEEETVLGLGWLLGSATDLVYNQNCIDEGEIIAQFMSDIQILATLYLSHPKYNKVVMYINMCIRASQPL